ncbi:MAG: hypothetical protein ACI4HQ_11010 [Acetatifactor sp.]
MTEKMIEFLLKNANPSIIYRVKKEILININVEEENRLQEMIMSEKIVGMIVDCQKENGWLGNGYHGSDRNAGQYGSRSKVSGRKGNQKGRRSFKESNDGIYGTSEYGSMLSKYVEYQ